MNATEAEAAAPKRRVVLAEDEAIIRLDLRETLEALGYEVVGETGRGDEAIGLIHSLEPDIAILDVKMPGRTGISVAEELAEENPCAVLILTAYSQAELIEQAAGAGVLAYLVKPFQKNELHASLEVAYARHLQMRSLADETADLRERFEVRKLVDRAKGLLMDSHGLSESEAFEFVQRTAMETRQQMRTVAEKVISGDLNPEEE